jgi:hypothetical protein
MSGHVMAADEKKPKPKEKAAVEPKEKAAIEPKDKTAEAPAKAETKAEAKPETKAEAPKNYSRGEGQKTVTQAYKDNWNAIYGKKKR